MQCPARSGTQTHKRPSCQGILVAYARQMAVMQVEVHKWTGSGLERGSPLVDGNPRLITSLAVVSNRYILMGNQQKGLMFLSVVEDKGIFKLLSRDFGHCDAAAVDFLVYNTFLGMVHADSAGHIAVFMYQRIGSLYEPAGIKAVPVGRFYVGHKVLLHFPLLSL
jgi:hypothetical protein